MTQSPGVYTAPSSGSSSVPVQLSRSPLFQKGPLALESYLGASFLGVACLTNYEVMLLRFLGDTAGNGGWRRLCLFGERLLHPCGMKQVSGLNLQLWVFLVKDRMWPCVGGAGDSTAHGLVRPGPCEQGPFSNDNEPGTDLSHSRPFLPSVRNQLWPPSCPPVHG